VADQFDLFWVANIDGKWKKLCIINLSVQKMVKNDI
jgi:hypothetical protein